MRPSSAEAAPITPSFPDHCCSDHLASRKPNDEGDHRAGRKTDVPDLVTSLEEYFLMLNFDGPEIRLD
jgi:hypothetical protein